MIELSQKVVSLAQDQLKLPLQCHLKSEWGANVESYRSRIREELLTCFPQNSSLLDLSRPPLLPDHSISISHTLNLGGFVSTKSPPYIGFDIEIKSRISEKIASRVAQEGELSILSAPHLWVAKEAAYKSMGQYQPRVMSEIIILSCHPLLEFKAYHFTYKGPRPGSSQTGFIIEHQEFCLAVAMHKPEKT